MALLEDGTSDSQYEESFNINEIEEPEVDPIIDIVDYLVRCAKISFKNAHCDEQEVRTDDKIKMAHELYTRSPTEFLMQFGKYLAPAHLGYFENLKMTNGECFHKCIEHLKSYHSETSKRKRVRNRRFKALQKLQNESDYFSEKQMMSRNPLLYEQLVGQYLTDKEIKDRDGVDRENLTFLNMILETVEKNEMREMKNEQMLEEEMDIDSLSIKEMGNATNDCIPKKTKHWGDFDTPDTQPSHKPDVRTQSMISAPERSLLREEFLQEMYNSFIEGRDADIDYNSIDHDEQYDDLQQVSQDAEDRYFDSEPNDVENLEEHMKLVQEYGRKSSASSIGEDPLDIFMKHISNK